MNEKKVVAFGEVMMRLTTKGFQRFVQADEYTATFGGSEANVAVELAKRYATSEVVPLSPVLVYRLAINPPPQYPQFLQ